ncbi:hypothetical protein [Roseicitreum antarcticum]|uniref:Lipoprotein n=1 Tax=Roseicitreum antarcticum TaxID=564137 RepID=A0A1H2XP88_9RHOB|nr:hypothetical protein [Roseicitreum antarcticum]SDW94667.1 hypothetical protein SAMN04488238_104269 [Roseicitreum antarcticum]
MRKPLLAAVALTLTLGACGWASQTRLNPFNWFGSSEETTLEPAAGYATVVDGRPLVSAVTDMAVERNPGGAIVRAEGVTPTQGWWDAELLPENEGRPVNGVLTFRFVIAPPRQATRVSTEVSRTVTAAVTLSMFDLENVTTIVVQGAQNQRTARR